MVSHDIKLSPQEIRTWSLSDLIDVASDIITRNDLEAYSFYFPDGENKSNIKNKQYKKQHK